MSVKMTNEQVKVLKAELKKQIEQLTSKTGNPTSYRLANKEPYSNSSELVADQERLKQSVAEYYSLIECFDVATLTLKKSLSFTDGRFTLRYNPQKNMWNFYDGSEYKSSDVRFSDDGETCTVYVPVRNSDTNGELVNYIYTLKTASAPDPIVEKAKAEPACNKIDEGLGAVAQPTNSYMESLGFVFDKTYHKWRKPTPLEYEEKQKADPNYQPAKKPEEKKKGFGFSSFLGKGSKEPKERLRR